MPWPFKRPESTRFSSKTAPSEGLYDLHSHILPGVDDGAVDMDESHAMLDGLAELGYVLVAATPHFNSIDLMPDVATQEELIEELRTGRSGRGPEIGTGAEIVFDDLFLREEEQGNIPRIGGERVYLVEFGFGPGSVPPRVEEAFFFFFVKGGNLILAHPERVPDFQRDPARLKPVYNSGAFLQVDLLSLDGKHGSTAKRMAFDLIDEGLVDIVSSDLHSPSDLDGLSRALKELNDWNRDEFIRLVSLNPKAILEGRPNAVIRNE